MREWLKAQTGQNVMSGFPLGTPIWPVVTLERFGGSSTDCEDLPRARLRVWDENKSNAEKVVVALGRLLQNSDGRRTEISPGLWLVAVEVHRLAWWPDVSLDYQPSYILDATLAFTES